jgi:hypothetical protein
VRINKVYPDLVPNTGVPSIVLDFAINVVSVIAGSPDRV